MAPHNSLRCLHHCNTRFTAFAMEQLRISTLNIWSATVGSLYEFLFAKYKMKYFIQYFQIGNILIPSGIPGNFVRKTGKREMKKVANSREFSKPGSCFPHPNYMQTNRFSKSMSFKMRVHERNFLLQLLLKINAHFSRCYCSKNLP